MEEENKETGKSEITSFSVSEKELSGGEKRRIILPDTSWLVAILDEKDSHHVAAESSLGALLPYKPIFYIPVLAAMETISRLIRVNKMSVKECRKKVSKLFSAKLKAQGASRVYSFKEILNIYDKLSRKEIKKLTAIDFSIVTEGITLNAKILTCDVQMYRVTKKYYKEIYFMTDKVDAQESDLARLIHDIQSRK